VGIPEPPEVDHQARAVREVEDQAALFGQGVAGDEQNLAAHPQAEKQPAPRRLDEDPLATGAHVPNFCAGQGDDELFLRHIEALCRARTVISGNSGIVPPF